MHNNKTPHTLRHTDKHSKTTHFKHQKQTKHVFSVHDKHVLALPDALAFMLLAHDPVAGPDGLDDVGHRHVVRLLAVLEQPVQVL